MQSVKQGDIKCHFKSLVWSNLRLNPGLPGHWWTLSPLDRMVRVLANGPGDQGSIPGRIIPKTQKWYLMPSCLTLSIIMYGLRVKWRNPGKGGAPSPTPLCSSNQKGSLRVTLDYGRLLYITGHWHYFSRVHLARTPGRWFKG